MAEPLAKRRPASQFFDLICCMRDHALAVGTTMVAQLRINRIRFKKRNAADIGIVDGGGDRDCSAWCASSTKTTNVRRFTTC
jgi:hypothetical protein